MASFLTRSTVSLASAALIAMAVVPAFAQPEETPPPPPEEMPMPDHGMRSEPANTETSPEGMRLRKQQQAAPARCRSGADTEAEAVEDCKKTLNCQPPTPTVKCSYRSNNQDWICRCVP